MSNLMQSSQSVPQPVKYSQSQPQPYDSSLPVVAPQTQICATLSNAVCVDNKAKCKWSGPENTGQCVILKNNSI